MKLKVLTAIIEGTNEPAFYNNYVGSHSRQDLQHLEKGTSNAKPVTIQFWVRSPKTGVHVVELVDQSNSARHINKSYTISSANTWQKVEITFEGDTTGAITNDNGRRLDLNFWLMAGSTYSSGTLQTSWGSDTNANRAVGQVNVVDSTSNDFYLTGVQLEVGSQATAFEHRTVGDELTLCQRYYFKYLEGNQTDPLLELKKRDLDLQEAEINRRAMNDQERLKFDQEKTEEQEKIQREKIQSNEDISQLRANVNLSKQRGN